MSRIIGAALGCLVLGAMIFALELEAVYVYTGSLPF